MRGRRGRSYYRERDQEMGKVLWYIYCLSDDQRWVLMGARSSKEDAERIVKDFEKEGKKCKVVLGSF